MATFSQRNGFAPAPSSAPAEAGGCALSPSLRTALWNVVLARLFGKLSVNGEGRVTQEYHVFLNAWRNFFVLPMDEFEKYLASRKEWYRDHFETMSAARVFEFFEFVAGKMIAFDSAEWAADTNVALEAEGSRWRLVGGRFVPLAAPGASETLQEALAECLMREWKLPSDHLKSALTALARGEHGAAVECAKSAVLAFHAELQGGAASEAFAASSFSVALRELCSDARLALSPRVIAATTAVFSANEPEVTAVAMSEADCAFVLSCTGAFVNAAISCAVSAGLLPCSDRSVLAKPVLDLWGESRLAARVQL